MAQAGNAAVVNNNPEGLTRIDQQSNPLAGRVRGKHDDNYSIVLQLSLVWGTKLD